MIEEIIFIIVRGIGAGALFSLVAMSFNIVHRSSHILNFAQGNMLVLGGLSAFLFFQPQDGVALWIALLVAATIGMGATLAVQGWVTLLPLRFTAEQDSWLITTMAASVM
ncbi:MAG: branched-chain amino acid ABC transporter permease, partial [Nevskiales bacterium]